LMVIVKLFLIIGRCLVGDSGDYVNVNVVGDEI
jgi:hypothetical protein